MSSVSTHASVEHRRSHYSYFVRTLETCEKMELSPLLELETEVPQPHSLRSGKCFSTMQRINDYWARVASLTPFLYLQQSESRAASLS
jgi:hypothetical protein